MTPMVRSPPDFSVQRILQASTLGWATVPFSRRSSGPEGGIQPGSLALQADSLPSEPPGKPISKSTQIAKKVKVSSPQSCRTLCNPMDYSPPGSSVQGDFPGKNTGMGCHSLLQGISPPQGLNVGLLHWQANS